MIALKQNKIKKEIFLDELPRWNEGTNKGKIDWKNSIGYKVRFIYDNIEGEIEILDYEKKHRKLIIKYNEDKYVIPISSIFNCMLSKMLKVQTSEFRYNIGDIVNNLKILECIKKKDKSNKCWKYYKYICNKDSYIGYISEYNLKNGYGCPVCGKKIAVLGINTIYDTDKWMIPYVGEEIAKKYNSQSNKSIYPICNICGNKKSNKMKISEIYRYKGFKCEICNDSISYCEKLLYIILKQLSINFITQYSKTNSKWCNKYRYDFYFEKDGQEYIIETHGKQHYEEKGRNSNWSPLKEIQENDKNKKELAIYNGIKEENYIVIDCRKSELEYIKNNILQSRLKDIFNLNDIGWEKCESYARNNTLIKETCEIKNKNNNLTTMQIAKIIKHTQQAVIKWLKIGTKLGWCNYNPKEEYNKGIKKINKIINLVEIFRDGKSLGVFKNCMDLERQSEKLFGTKLNAKQISAVCKNKQKTHKGFTFKYIEQSQI